MASLEHPVYVVGVFRSGTSLLCSLLNQNKNIALMYECDVWNFPRPLLKPRFKGRWAERIEFHNQALSRHRMMAPHDTRPLKDIHTPLDLYRAFGEMKGAMVSGEKSPFYCDRLEQLHQQHPGALFIFVWRDPVEIYRSVLKAGQTSRFFGKPGMLSRMIYQQEQAIRQAGRIEAKGARVYRLDYVGLVEQTERVCREASAFLGVPFDPQMSHLNQADLSSIYAAPHHAYLRRGVIERQEYEENLIPPAIERKLERYRHRWGQLHPESSGGAAGPDQASPGRVEFFYHHVAGWFLTTYDSVVRAGFEFLPLGWLRVYRLLKYWVLNPPSRDMDAKPPSMFSEFRRHWQTIATATVLLGLVGLFQFYANPHLKFALFYAVPCVLVALVVNTRWASLFVLACSLLSQIIQHYSDLSYHSTGVFVWNFVARLILLEILILLISRIRLEFSNLGDRAVE